jgi:sialidase-1
LKDFFSGRALMVKSTDDGVSWSEPEDITPQVGVFVAGPSVGIQLASGRLIIPGYTGHGGVPAWRSQSRVIYSDDHGKTWKAGSSVGGFTNESQAVELTDGTLMLNARRRDKVPYRYVALSRDRGETWMKTYDDKALVDPVCQASLWRYTRANGDGKSRLLFSNPANAERNDRSNMTVRLSHDEGSTWPVSRQVCAGPAGYSCLAILADGNIGLLYESGDKQPYKKITFARFNLEWLTGSAESP